LTGEAAVAGISSERVVAVVASLDTGLVQVGSGFLVSARRVVTAAHCTFDRKTKLPVSFPRVGGHRT
jgi:hypothetical protein